MDGRWVLCFLCCHLVLAAASNSLTKDDKKPSKNKDSFPIPKSGTFVNCGNPATDFSLNFRPATVRFGDHVTINGVLMSAEDLSEGYLNATIYIGDENEPLYRTPPGDGHFTCNDIHKYVRFMCPFQRNKKSVIKDYKFYLSPSFGVPVGDFRIRLSILNKDWKEILCTYGHIVVLDD